MNAIYELTNELIKSSDNFDDINKEKLKKLENHIQQERLNYLNNTIWKKKVKLYHGIQNNISNYKEYCLKNINYIIPTIVDKKDTQMIFKFLNKDFFDNFIFSSLRVATLFTLIQFTTKLNAKQYNMMGIDNEIEKTIDIQTLLFNCFYNFSQYDVLYSMDDNSKLSLDNFEEFAQYACCCANTKKITVTRHHDEKIGCNKNDDCEDHYVDVINNFESHNLYVYNSEHCNLNSESDYDSDSDNDSVKIKVNEYTYLGTTIVNVDLQHAGQTFEMNSCPYDEYDVECNKIIYGKIFDFSKFYFKIDEINECEYECTFEPIQKIQHASFCSAVPVTCEETWMTGSEFYTVKSMKLKYEYDDDSVIVTTDYLGIDCL